MDEFDQYPTFMNHFYKPFDFLSLNDGEIMTFKMLISEMLKIINYKSDLKECQQERSYVLDVLFSVWYQIFVRCPYCNITHAVTKLKNTPVRIPVTMEIASVMLRAKS